MCYVYIVIVAFGDNDIGQVDGTTIQVHSCSQRSLDLEVRNLSIVSHGSQIERVVFSAIA